MDECEILNHQITLLSESFEKIRLQLVNYKMNLEALNSEMKSAQELEMMLNVPSPPESECASPELDMTKTHPMELYFTQIDYLMQSFEELKNRQESHIHQLKALQSKQIGLQNQIHTNQHQPPVITETTTAPDNSLSQFKFFSKKKRRWSFSTSKRQKRFNWWGITHYPLPRSFCGTKDIDQLDSWISQVQKYINYTEIDDEKSAIKIASSLLADDALDWWESYHMTNNQPPKTLQQFLNELQCHFQPISAIDLKREKSIIDYIFKFENLVMTGEHFARMPEVQKMEAFLNGLDNPKFVDWIQARRPKGLSQVIALALELDQLSAIAPSEEPPMTKAERRKSMRKPEPPKCAYCSKKGHIELHCFLKQMHQLNRPQTDYTL